MNFYTADERHPFVRQFKVLDTIAGLEPLLQKLRPVTRRVVLFGSCAEGTDTADSDVDLFVVAPDRGQVMGEISHCHFDRQTQPVLVNNQELATLKQEGVAFYTQVQRGIVLWDVVDGMRNPDRRSPAEYPEN